MAKRRLLRSDSEELSDLRSIVASYEGFLSRLIGYWGLPEAGGLTRFEQANAHLGVLVRGKKSEQWQKDKKGVPF